MDHREPFRDADLTVTISHLLVATAQSSDPLLDDAVPELLRAMRQRMAMDVVFVSEFVDGQRMFRFVDFSAAPRPDLVQADLDKLRVCATLVARTVELNQARGIQEPPPHWKLQPLDEHDSPAWRQGPCRNNPA
jgi:hypothetical protein